MRTTSRILSAVARAVVFALALGAPAPSDAYEFYRPRPSTGWWRLSSTHGDGHLFLLDGCAFERGGSWNSRIGMAAAQWNEVRGMRDKFILEWEDCDNMDQRPYSAQSKISTKQIRAAASMRAKRLNWWTQRIERVVIWLDPEDVEPAGPNDHSCNDEFNRMFVRNIAQHEMMHALGFAHDRDFARQTLLHTASWAPNGELSSAPYCDGTKSLFSPHANDANGGRKLYPTPYQHRDVAALGWIANDQPNRYGGRFGAVRALPALPAEGHQEVCPGEIVTQEFAAANRGNVKMHYDRRYWWADDDDLSSGWKESLTTVANASKSPSSRYGEYENQILLEVPSTIPEDSKIHMELINISPVQTPGTARRNDATYFWNVYRDGEELCE